MSPRPSRPPRRPNLIANPSTRSPGWIYPLLATLAIVTALALVLAIVTPAGWQNPRTGLSGTNGPAFTPTMAEPLPGTPTDDLTSDPGLSALSTDEAIRAEWLTPTATTVPSSTAVPLDWCEPERQHEGDICRQPPPTPTAGPPRAPRVVDPSPTLPACFSAESVGDNPCQWRPTETPMATPDLVSVTDTILAPAGPARMWLEASGFTVEVVCAPSGDAFNDPGVVYQSDPGPGARIARGSIVILSVEPPCPPTETPVPVPVPTSAAGVPTSAPIPGPLGTTP